MPLLTIVEHYIFAALNQAVAEEQEDGTVVATVAALPGLIAYGRNTHECAAECFRLIEQTVKNWLEAGYEIPTIGGIDLNSERGQVLASYHEHSASHDEPDPFYDEEAFDAALEAYTAAG